MFSAYFDASGNRETPVLTFGGFVSRAKKWDRFEREWESILRSVGVSYFHMTDFASSQGQFPGWKGHTRKRREFFDKLVGCINRNTNKGFCSSVSVSDYDVVNQTYLLREACGNPYSFCGLSCLQALQDWAKKKSIPVSRVLVLVESGDDGQRDFIRRARDQGFKVVPIRKEDAHALAAGDLAAWKSRIVLQEAETKPIRSEEDLYNILRSLDQIKTVVQKMEDLALVSFAM
jgi:hypothetical protein